MTLYLGTRSDPFEGHSLPLPCQEIPLLSLHLATRLALAGKNGGANSKNTSMISAYHNAASLPSLVVCDVAVTDREDSRGKHFDWFSSGSMASKPLLALQHSHILCRCAR